MPNIYFIQSGKRGQIKIGVANDVPVRMAELQIGNPQELKLLASIPISSLKKAGALEKSLHRRFSRQRIRGEWFHRSIRVKEALGFFEASFNLPQG